VISQCSFLIGREEVEKATEPTLNEKETKRIQSISGTSNYYSEIDPCIKTALNEIAHEQAKPTLTTKRRSDHLLDFLATNQEATLRYHASDMILVIETDAAYLVLLSMSVSLVRGQSHSMLSLYRGRFESNS